MVIFMNGENLTCLSTDTLLLSYSAVVFFICHRSWKFCVRTKAMRGEAASGRAAFFARFYNSTTWRLKSHIKPLDTWANVLLVVFSYSGIPFPSLQ